MENSAVVNDHYSYCTLTYRGNEIKKAVAQVANAGYDGIELYPKDWQWGFSELGETQFINLFTKAKLTVSAVFGGVLDQTLGVLEQAAVVGNMLGTKHIFVVAPASETVGYVQCVNIFRRASRLASAYGLTLLIHNHAGTFMELLETAAQLCAAVQEPNFGLCLDSLHFALFDDEIQDKLSCVLPHVQYVHLKDMDVPRQKLYHIKPKEEWRWGNLAHLEAHYTDLDAGVINNRKIAASIKDFGYKGWWLPEIERATRAREIHVRQNFERIRSYF